MLTRTSPGTPVLWSIGARGSTPDVYPGRTIDRPVLTRDDRGRQAMVVNVIAQRKNLAGENYLTERLLNVRFLKERTFRVEALDGTKAEPLSVSDLVAKHEEGLEAFQESQAAEMSVDALAAMVD